MKSFRWLALPAALLSVTLANADVVPSPAQFTYGLTDSDTSVPSGPYPSTINATYANWQVGGTDLGIPWATPDGQIFLAFGDTFATMDTSKGNPFTATDWRRGAIARSYDGVRFIDMMTNSTGHAGLPNPPAGYANLGLVLPAKPNTPADQGAIACSGFSVTNGSLIDDYVSYIGIGNFCPSTPGEWWSVTSGIARGSHAWKGGSSGVDRLVWPWGSTSNFAAPTMLLRGDYVYVFGVPSGRGGQVQLARTTLASLRAGTPLFQYWTGSTWSNAESSAVYIAPAPLAELSVQFDATFGRFLMTYLDIDRMKIVMRDAASLEGPYGEEKDLYDATVDWAYGGFMYPSPGSSVQYTISNWKYYSVSQYTSNLSWRYGDDNLLTDPGFELQPNPSNLASTHLAVSAPWTAVNGSNWMVGIDHNNGFQRSGSNNAYFRASDFLPHEINQTIAVKPGATYRLSGWIKGTGVTGFGGVRTATPRVAVDGTPCHGYATDPQFAAWPIASTTFTAGSGYTPFRVDFNAGSNTLLNVFVGFNGTGSDQYIQVDDLSLVALDVMRDGGFEMQQSTGIGWPYGVEGPGPTGIDQSAGYARTGLANAWIHPSDSNTWHAITQVLAVHPYSFYRLRAWVQTSSTLGSGYFGVRDAGTGAILKQTSFGASPNGYTQLDVLVGTGASTSIKIFTGYWTPPPPTYVFLPRPDTWLRLDDVTLEQL